MDNTDDTLNAKALHDKDKDKDELHNMASCMLSILDSLKLYDNDSLLLEDETLSEVMFRKMKAYNIDLNQELGFTHLKPVSELCTVLSPIVSSELLSNWDAAIVDLNRNGGMFKSSNVRLRNCSLHYNDVFGEYYVKYGSVTYRMHDIYNMR
jgi:hypothetical protein|tara:strand:- start:4425 stop:4880 length:456 start_codon:yes stop_codon:yes gene_type:complete